MRPTYGAHPSMEGTRVLSTYQIASAIRSSRLPGSLELREHAVGPGRCSKRFSSFRCIESTRSCVESIKIDVRKLSKRSENGETILDGVSFSVQAGRVHALVGPSGCGKTTVLRALNRLWEPPSGTVFYEGVDVTAMDVISLRLRVGMIFQTAALFKGTVADNLQYGPKLRGKILSKERLEELLLQAGFAEPSLVLGKSSRELSGGESQRVGLARALANDPSVLLMDEPTSSLDPASTRLVEQAVMSLVSELSKTVVLVSHDLNQVSRVADHATVLGQGGAVLESGTPAELSRNDNEALTKFFAGE